VSASNEMDLHAAMSIAATGVRAINLPLDLPPLDAGFVRRAPCFRHSGAGAADRAAAAAVLSYHRREPMLASQ